MKGRKNREGFVHIGNIIEDVLRSFRRESDTELTQVWQIWQSIVGEAVAENAQPAAFKGTLLLVHVSSSTWIHHLQFLKKDIIRKLNSALGKSLIEEIRFKIGPLNN